MHLELACGMNQDLAYKHLILCFQQMQLERLLSLPQQQYLLLPLLQQHGYELVTAETLTIPEQVQLFREATHLVAPHGAGLVNGLFMPRFARILEIRPVPESGAGCFDALFQLGWPGHEVLVPPDSGRFALPPKQLSAVLERWRREEAP